MYCLPVVDVARDISVPIGNKLCCLSSVHVSPEMLSFTLCDAYCVC